MGNERANRRLNPLLGWAVALLAMAAFCGLGMWQLGRAKQKEAMLADVRKVLFATRQAVPLAVVSDASRAHGYDWAAGQGRFADAPAVLLDNQSHNDRNGVRVYRLFESGPHAAPPLLVELGWLPLPGDRSMPVVARPAGTALIVRGLLAPPPSRGLVEATATPLANGGVLVTGLDAPQLPALLGVKALPPRVLKLDPVLPMGYSRDLDILPNTLPPERHLGYAVQWFGLALAVFVTALLLSLRRRRRAHEKMAA